MVFADLVGFTTFSEAADPEHVKNLVDDCFDRLAGNVTAFGGHVDKIVGDALIALFGAPVAHEDDPERAVRAALALQQSMDEFCEGHDVAVELRVGVNTGEVLVGAIRAGDDYTAMGDVVNTASRLQTAAAPGQVLVGNSTYEATSAVVRYEPGGELDVRGRGEPVRAWIAREALVPPGRRTSRGPTPLVGRSAELNQICETIESAKARRRAQLLLLLGEAGVGKTRLAREATATCGAAPSSIVLHGQCVPYGETNVWWPIGEAIRGAIELDPPTSDDVEKRTTEAVRDTLGLAADDAEAGRIASGLLSLMGRVDVPEEIDPARARDEATRAAQVFLEGLASRQPVILVLSDLHWAEPDVLELVDALLTRMRALPFVLLATARPELSDRWSPSTRHDVSVLHVDPLDPAATSALVRAHLGADTPEPVIELLLERSGGNPFFIEELAALVAESDTAVDGGARAMAPEARVRALPATLRGLVAARLDALTPAARSVLEDAAVAGSTGPVELIVSLGETRGEADVQAHVRELADRDLLRVDDCDYAFASELVREIAYGTLTKAERARRHGAVGDWIEGAGGERERDTDRLEQLALHLGTAAELAREMGGVEGLASDIRTRALQAHEAAARHAERSESWPRAEHHFAAATALADDDDPEQAHRRLGLAHARVEGHRIEEVRPDLDATLRQARQAGDRKLELEALLVLGLLEQRASDYPAAIAAYDAAVGIADELGAKGAIAEGLRGRGMSLMFQGDLDGAEDAITLALDIFRGYDDRRGEAWALQNLAWIAFYRGQPTLAEERVTAAIDMFSELRDWGGLDWALGLFAWVRFNQGRLQEAEQLAERVLEDSADTGDLWALGMMGVLLAQVAMWTGRPARAIDRGRDAQHRFDAIGDAWGALQSCIPQTRALACLGRIDEADAVLETMQATTATIADELTSSLPALVSAAIGGHIGDVPRGLAITEAVVDEHLRGAAVEERLTTQGVALLQAGRAQEARAALEEAFEHASSESARAASGGILAMARAATGDAEEAFALTEELTATEVGSYLDRLQAWMARGLIGAQLGRATDTRAAVDRAVELADATESPLDQALARLARAHALEELANADAEPTRRDAQERLARLGYDADGWAMAFRMTARGADAPAESH